MGASAFVVRDTEGKPLSAKEVIVMRRGAFKWLPVLCSNDLVHGSWYASIKNYFPITPYRSFITAGGLSGDP